MRRNTYNENLGDANTNLVYKIREFIERNTDLFFLFRPFWMLSQAVSEQTSGKAEAERTNAYFRFCHSPKACFADHLLDSVRNLVAIWNSDVLSVANDILKH